MEGEEVDPTMSVTGKLLRDLHVMHRGMVEGFSESAAPEEGEISLDDSPEITGQQVWVSG